MPEEELIEAYGNVIEKAGMMRYLLASDHGIVQEPFKNPLGTGSEGRLRGAKTAKGIPPRSYVARGPDVLDVTNIVLST